MRFSIDGQVALVTGASRGLGLAMARGLAEAGARVVLNGRDPATLAAAAATLEAQGLAADVEAFDVADRQAAPAAVARIAARFGRLDILVCNAGVQHRAPLAAFDDAAWDRVVDADLSACFRLARAAAGPMTAQGRGRMIFTSSITGRMGRATVHAYVAAKGGLAALARSLAAELGPAGITCNSIAPGYFETEMNEKLLADPAFSGAIAARTALKRWGRPEEIAGACVFLASDAAAYVTGHELVVDGGFTGTLSM